MPFVPPRADDLQPWARNVVVRGSAAYAACSITAAAVAAGHLAWQAGYDWDPRSVLFGCAFEVAAIVTGAAWAGSREGSYWYHVGKRATLGFFAASLAIQVVEVLAVRDYLPPEALLGVAALVSVVFPVLALLFGHLGMAARRADVDAQAARLAREEREAELQRALDEALDAAREQAERDAVAREQDRQTLLAQIERERQQAATRERELHGQARQLQGQFDDVLEHLENARVQADAATERAARAEQAGRTTTRNVPPGDGLAPAPGGDPAPDDGFQGVVAPWLAEVPALAGTERYVLAAVQFIHRGRRDGTPHGQRPTSDYVGMPRGRVAGVIDAAKALLDGPDGAAIASAIDQVDGITPPVPTGRVNGHPIPTAGD